MHGRHRHIANLSVDKNESRFQNSFNKEYKADLRKMMGKDTLKNQRPSTGAKITSATTVTTFVHPMPLLNL
jgi:hypothetical protein